MVEGFQLEAFWFLRKIAARAQEEVFWHQPDPQAVRLDVLMDLCACYQYGCPIDWQLLLGASANDFAHDILGIREHLNRGMGRLEGNFMPRAAKTRATRGAQREALTG